MWLRAVATIGLLAACAASGLRPGHAQTASDGNAGGQHGKLTVWRVVRESPPGPATIASLAPVVHSTTAGSFGQTAGSFGQPAGNTGQTAGSFGGTVESKTAGSVGQTAGSFGESVGTLADAAAVSNGTVLPLKRDAAWDKFTDEANGNFRALDVTYTDVGVDDLPARLEAVRTGQPDAPDVLVGTPFPTGATTGVLQRFGLATLGAIALIPQMETPEQRSAGLHPQAVVLARAPHPRAARAFVLWLLERSACALCVGEDRGDPAAIAVAKSSLSSVLNGESMGDLADSEMAPFNPQLAREAALAVSGAGLGNGLRIDIDAVRASANGRLAVLSMRAVLEGRSAFGVVHAVAVLRADEAGRWRVLQLTPNLLPAQQLVAWQSLVDYAHPLDSRAANVLGVTLAAPVDGDNRPPAPELWWDNKGGATLEVVEWQRRSDRTWTPSNLFFVPDDTGHLQTRVTARFAEVPASYRWRVWSLARGGAVAISPWRGFNITPQ